MKETSLPSQSADSLTDFDRVLIAKCEAMSRWDWGFVSLCDRLADTPQARVKICDIAVEKYYEAHESL